MFSDQKDKWNNFKNNYLKKINLPQGVPPIVFLEIFNPVSTPMYIENKYKIVDVCKYWNNLDAGEILWAAKSLKQQDRWEKLFF